jgi:DNA-binding MarR family transcriptional regulator
MPPSRQVPMPEQDRLPDVRTTAQAWESLFRTQVAVMRRLQGLPEFRKLSTREYDVLFNLSRCPTGWSRLNELNEALLISQPSLSRMVERLEAKGLLQRRPAEQDQRGIEISLTEEGRELQRAIGREHVRHLHEMIAPALSAEEFGQLQSLTEKLRDGLKRER